MYAPMIERGEMIDGYLGRIKVLSRFSDLPALRKTLVKKYRQSSDYRHKRKDEVRDLIDVMQSYTGKSRYELINEHTCCPSEYLDWMLIDWEKLLATRKAMTLPFFKFNQHSAKLCVQCVACDKSEIGTSIWHRSHQVSGMVFCPIHRGEKLLKAWSSTHVYRNLPEWYLKHRDLEPYENYPIAFKAHEEKLKHYGELITSLMNRRSQISDFLLIRIVEKLKHQPLHQGLKRRVPFESACAPKTWFMSSKYPRRWLWTNFASTGEIDFYLPSLNQIQKNSWAEIILVLASFTQSVSQVNEMIDSELSVRSVSHMLTEMNGRY